MKFTEIKFNDLAKTKGLKPIHVQNLPSVIAIAGKNGSGKSRFLNCIKELADSSEICRQSFGCIPDTFLSFLTQYTPKTSLINLYNESELKEISQTREFRLTSSNKTILDDIGYEIKNYCREMVKHINTSLIQELSMNYEDTLENEPLEITQNTTSELTETHMKEVEKFESLFEYSFEDISQNELEIIQTCGYSYLIHLFRLVHQEDTRYKRDTKRAQNSPANLKWARLNYFVEIFLKKQFDVNLNQTPLHKNKSILSYTPVLNDQSNDRPFVSSELSPGEKILLTMSLLFFVLDQNPNYPLRECILLLDEPECHLHPDVLIKMIHGIKDVIQDKGQLIFATHSVELLSSLKHNEVFLMKNSELIAPSSYYYTGSCPTSYDAIHELLGLEIPHMLNDFLRSPAYWVIGEFIAQCLSVPQVLEKCKDNDPQLKVIQKAIDTQKSHILLDFGAGKGRLLKELFTPGSTTENVILYAYERDPECVEKLAQLKHITETYTSKDELPKDSFDCIIMCNVVHEIIPSDWVENFQICFHSLRAGGRLLIVEDLLLPIGEQPNICGYIIPDQEAIQHLFNLSEPPQVYKCSDNNYSERILCAEITKDQLSNCSKTTLIKTIETIKKHTLRKIEDIRHIIANKEKLTLCKGRELAFHNQHFVNCTIALDDLNNS